ncbi:MAG TPA: hypothetical protein VJ870_16725 [Amycolatopsis sp.]|nr:hypothetical protein [Amycolatopsis sp.]
MKTLIIPAVAGALALTACGGAPAAPQVTAQAAAAPVSTQAVPCATVAASSSSQVRVLVRQGNVDCAQATAIATQYFARLTPADRADPGGAGPVALEEWTCGSDPGSPLTATCSTEDNREIGTVPA